MPKSFEFYGGPGFDQRALSEVLGEGIRAESEAAALRFRGTESIRDALTGTLRDRADRAFAREQQMNEMRFRDQQARLDFGRQAQLQAMQERGATKRAQMGIEADLAIQAQRQMAAQQQQMLATAATNRALQWSIDERKNYQRDYDRSYANMVFPRMSEAEIKAEISIARPDLAGNPEQWAAFWKELNATRPNKVYLEDKIKGIAIELNTQFGQEAALAALKHPTLGIGDEVLTLEEQVEMIHAKAREHVFRNMLGTLAPPLQRTVTSETSAGAADARLEEQIASGEAQPGVVTADLFKTIGVGVPRELGMQNKTGISVTPDYNRILEDGQPYLAPGEVLQGAARKAWDDTFNRPHAEDRSRLLFRLIKGADTTRDETDRFHIKVWENRAAAPAEPQQQAPTPTSQAPVYIQGAQQSESIVAPPDYNLPGRPEMEGVEYRRPNLSQTELLRIRSGAFSYDSMKKKRKEK